MSGAAPQVTYRRLSEVGGPRPPSPLQVDPVRDEEQTRLRFQIREGKMFALIPGVGLVLAKDAKDGWHTVTVYESNVPLILDMVETDHGWDSWDRAKRMWARKLRDRVIDRLGANKAAHPPPDSDPRTWEGPAADLRDRDVGSPEAEMHHETGRGLKKLSRVEIIEEGIAPPMSEQERSTAKVVEGYGKLIAEALGRQGGRGGDNEEIVELRAENRALRSQISDLATRFDALMAKLGEGDNTKEGA